MLGGNGFNETRVSEKRTPWQSKNKEDNAGKMGNVTIYIRRHFSSLNEHLHSDKRHTEGRKTPKLAEKVNFTGRHSA